MSGITPLHYCIFRGNNHQAFEIIERGEADLDAGDKGGQTPIHLACYRNNTKIVTRLVEAGADGSKADGSGNTPMHAAAEAGAVDVVRYLIDKGLKGGSSRNVEGFTPLEVAQRHCPHRQRSAMVTLLETLPCEEATKMETESEKPCSPPATDDSRSSSSDHTAAAAAARDAGGLGTHKIAQDGDSEVVAGNVALGVRMETAAASAAEAMAAMKEIEAMLRGRDLGREDDKTPRVTATLDGSSSSSNSTQQALYRTLSRQEQTIATLTEVVQTQANTIAALVAVVGRRVEDPTEGATT